MKEFDALKKNWQTQKPAGGMKLNADEIISDSLSRLRKFEKRIFRINMVKTAGIVLASALIIWSMLFVTPVSAVKIAGVAWLLISIAVFWTKYLMIQLRTGKLNVKEKSLDFIDDVLKNFSGQRGLFRKDFKFFGAALITGINILYLDLLNDMPPLERLSFHVLVSAVLTAALYAGIKFRMRRFKNENEPLENELIKMKEDLEESK